MTITEGLQEIKTLMKRIEKKREFVKGYLWRMNQIRDPHEAHGGSQEVVRKERQAIKDLEDNIVDLRRRIAEANAKTQVTVSGITKTIADWIIWRREIASPRKRFLEAMYSRIQSAREQATQKGIQIVNSELQAGGGDLIINVNEKDLAFEIEKTEDILSTLDGQLSMKNATISI